MSRRLAGLVCLVLVAAGCATGPFARNRTVPPPLTGQAPSKEQLIAHLNQEASGINSVEFRNVTVRANQGVKSFTIDGEMAYQKPRNFRLMAHVGLGSTVADVGSNDQEFWFWFKEGDGALYRCSYDDYARVRNLPVPIHPDWVAEALCVQELGSPEKYTMRTVGQRLELSTQTPGPQGQTLVKTTFVSLGRSNTGRVVGQQLRTLDGRELWSAEITEYQNAGGYVMPRKVIIRCPAEKMELHFALNQCRINGVTAGPNSALFQRPNGYQVIDLARGPGATPSSIQRVRGASGP